MHVLLIDNFDSFAFNLVEEFRRRGARVQVWRNDIAPRRALELAEDLPRPRLLVLSPGPGRPEEAGCCVELVRSAAGRIPVFGICLGHQAIVQAFGGSVGPAGEIIHGRATMIRHDGKGIFRGLPRPLMVGRYHSLAAKSLPGDLRASAWSGELVMALRHRALPLVGLQFHPESILSPCGGALIDNLLDGIDEAGGNPG